MKAGFVPNEPEILEITIRMEKHLGAFFPAVGAQVSSST